MKKLALLVSGTSAVVAMTVIGIGQASADPPDVTGEVYGKAVALLKASGYKAVFGGSVGDDLPQQQCRVASAQPISGSGFKLKLMLDCTLEEGETKPGAPNTHSLVPPGGSIPTGARPTPGAGTVTVTPVPVG